MIDKTKLTDHEIMKNRKVKKMIAGAFAMGDAFGERNMSAYAAQAAFFLILSFFPFMMFFFALLDLTPLTAEEFSMFAQVAVPESFWSILSDFTEEIYKGSSGGRLSFTVISAVFLSAKAFISLQNGLNSMYQSKETRNYLMRRINAIIYSVVFAVLLLFVLALLVFGDFIYDNFLDWIPLIRDMVHLRMLIVIPILFVFFLLLYVVLPNRKQGIRRQIPGAIVAAAGWILFSAFFSIYVDKYTRYTTFYGTMTMIVLLMLWLYGCMYVLFIGGFLNCTLEEKYWKVK